MHFTPLCLLIVAGAYSIQATELGPTVPSPHNPHGKGTQASDHANNPSLLDLAAEDVTEFIKKPDSHVEERELTESPRIRGRSSAGKRGLAYNTGGPNLNLFNNYAQINWAYNWDSTPGSLPSKYQFVPMLWGTSPDHTTQWSANVKKATGPTKYLMSFNEPDMTNSVGGSNISPSNAAKAFQKYMSPQAAAGYKLGSPGVSNGQGINPSTGQPQGLDWLKAFLKQCKGCPISFAPVHWYGCPPGQSCVVANDIAAFKQHILDAIKAVNGLPIWVTEFQCNENAGTFLAEVLPWLDHQPAVQRYSYFMVRDGILTNGNNKLSALGQKYGQTAF